MPQVTLPTGIKLNSPTIQYQIESILGQGSFGVTYKAKGFTVVKGALGEMKMELPQPIAIKEFFMRDINQRDASGSITGMSEGSMAYNYALKFRKEAENLARMNHPNIVRVIDFIEANNTYYYVMEYVEGEDMNSYLKSHKLSEEEAVSIIMDVANALKYMHEEQHMLHLDLKPGNIMRRNSDGHIFLIDFGLSKHYGDDGNPDTSTTVGLGTEGYAPLEQGKRTKDRNDFLPTIDIYALGATLYKLLTGKTPPAASDILDDDELLLTDLDAIGLTEEVKKAIVTSMQPGARKRPQSVDDFIKMLPDVRCKRVVSDFESNRQDENTKVINPENVDDLESLDEETRIALSDEDKHKIILFAKKGIINQPCNQPVDLGLSVNWYNSNVGACDPIDAGNYYDRKSPEYERYIDCHVNSKHIPTTEEWEELTTRCEWSWIEEYQCSGYLIKGPNGKHIFLPASGGYIKGKLTENEYDGYYWAEDKCKTSFGERNFKFKYPKTVSYIGTAFIIDIGSMPIRLVESKD